MSHRRKAINKQIENETKLLRKLEHQKNEWLDSEPPDLEDIIKKVNKQIRMRKKRIQGMEEARDTENIDELIRIEKKRLEQLRSDREKAIEENDDAERRRLNDEIIDETNRLEGKEAAKIASATYASGTAQHTNAQFAILDADEDEIFRAAFRIPISGSPMKVRGQHILMGREPGKTLSDESPVS